MRVRLDRFLPPTAADERATCQNCLTVVHYEELDDWGHCRDCRKDEPEEDDED